MYLALLSCGKPIYGLKEPYVSMGRNYYLYSYGNS
jgi:hypothetical protein